MTLDRKSAQLLMEAVNRGDGVHYGDIITFNEAQFKMEKVATTKREDYRILALQKGDMTILVWIDPMQKEEKCIRKVQFVCW